MQNLSKAILEFQAEIKPLIKNSFNPFTESFYVSLDEVWEVIRPILQKHKLSIVQFFKIVNNKNVLITWLLHETGEKIESEYLLPTIEHKKMNVIQAEGSAITYARRYNIFCILGLTANEDVDGYAENKQETKKEVKKEVKTKSITDMTPEAINEEINKAFKYLDYSVLELETTRASYKSDMDLLEFLRKEAIKKAKEEKRGENYERIIKKGSN